MVKVRRAFDRVGYPMESFEKTRTHQQYVAEADINNIMKRYKVTGLVPMVGGQPMYGDFSGLPDYQGALNMVIAANEMFMALPSDLRTRFSNDPGRFIDFVQSASVEQLLELGLARPLPRGPEGPPVNIDEPGEELEPA